MSADKSPATFSIFLIKRTLSKYWGYPLNFKAKIINLISKTTQKRAEKTTTKQ